MSPEELDIAAKLRSYQHKIVSLKAASGEMDPALDSLRSMKKSRDSRAAAEEGRGQEKGGSGNDQPSPGARLRRSSWRRSTACSRMSRSRSCGTRSCAFDFLIGAFYFST